MPTALWRGRQGRREAGARSIACRGSCEDITEKRRFNTRDFSLTQRANMTKDRDGVMRGVCPVFADLDHVAATPLELHDLVEFGQKVFLWSLKRCLPDHALWRDPEAPVYAVCACLDEGRALRRKRVTYWKCGICSTRLKDDAAVVQCDTCQYRWDAVACVSDDHETLVLHALAGNNTTKTPRRFALAGGAPVEPGMACFADHGQGLLEGVLTHGGAVSVSGGQPLLDWTPDPVVGVACARVRRRPDVHAVRRTRDGGRVWCSYVRPTGARCPPDGGALQVRHRPDRRRAGLSGGAAAPLAPPASTAAEGRRRRRPRRRRGGGSVPTPRLQSRRGRPPGTGTGSMKLPHQSVLAGTGAAWRGRGISVISPTRTRWGRASSTRARRTLQRPRASFAHGDVHDVGYSNRPDQALSIGVPTDVLATHRCEVFPDGGVRGFRRDQDVTLGGVTGRVEAVVADEQKLLVAFPEHHGIGPARRSAAGRRAGGRGAASPPRRSSTSGPRRRSATRTGPPCRRSGPTPWSPSSAWARPTETARRPNFDAYSRSRRRLGAVRRGRRAAPAEAGADEDGAHFAC